MGVECLLCVVSVEVEGCSDTVFILDTASVHIFDR